MPNAYSYIRFSSRRQADGDSLRRQLEARDGWLATHASLDLQLVEDYRDLGVSAWRGKNTAVGRLGAFLKLVEAGSIPRGSYLLIENLDRLTRADVTRAMNLLTGLMLAGIRVVTIMDGRVYSDAKAADTMSHLMLALVYMARAGDESEVKSDRGLRLRERKRVEVGSRKVITRMVPGWCTVVVDKVVENEHANTVRRIFEWSAEGQGSAAIVRRLNREGYEPINGSRRKDGASWSATYVRLILANRAVLGEFAPAKRSADDKRVLTGDVILNYYPQVVDPGLWQRAAGALQRRKDMESTPRPSASGPRNIFAGLGRCLECGGFMHVTAGREVSGSPGIRHLYIRCHNKYVTRTCKAGRLYPYRRLEKAALDEIEELLAAAQDGSNDQAVHGIDRDIAQLRLEVEQTSNRVKRMISRLGDDTDDDPDVMAAVDEARDLSRLARAKLAAAEATYLTMATKQPPGDALAEIRKLRAHIATEGSGEEVMTKLVHAVRGVVSSVGFAGDGDVIMAIAGDRRYEVFRNGKSYIGAWRDGTESRFDYSCSMEAFPESLDTPAARIAHFAVLKAGLHNLANRLASVSKATGSSVVHQAKKVDEVARKRNERFRSGMRGMRRPVTPPNDEA